MKKTLLILLFAFGVSYWGWGQTTLPHLDPINYAVGQALQTQTGWTTLNSGDNLLIASGSLSYSGLETPTYNKVTFDGAGIDAAKLFTQQASGTIYYSFLFNITSLGSLNSTGGYFTGFTEGTGTTFGATVWSRLDGVGFDIGINPRTTATNTVWSSGTTSINTTLFIVISYQLVTGTTNDIVKMWINPTPGSSEPSPTLTATNTLVDLANVNRILIRQDATTTTPFIEMDELRIGTTWADVTPSSVTGTPTKLVITSINAGNSPVSGLPYSVSVQAQDNSNTPQPVTSDVNITLSGTGIGGTTIGTILNGQNSVTISGVTMSEGYGLTITATQTSGTPTLTAGTSSAFYVMSTTPSYRTKVSGNWSVPGTWEIQISGNWYNAVEYPDAAYKNATVLNGHTIAITDNNGRFNNLTVDNGGIVWVGTTTARFLYAYGNITCNGTIGDAGGTDGLGFDIEGINCSISGNGLFKISRMAKFTTTNITTNLTINNDISLMYTHATNSALYNFNPGTTTFNITINPTGRLYAPNAKIDLTGCNLNLKSDAAGNASIIDNGTISGQTGTNVTVERYFSGNDPDYHLVSSPVSNATANVFFNMYLMSFNSLPSVPYGNPDWGYTDIVNPTTGLNVMEGYALYSFSATNTSSFVGNLNTGIQFHTFDLNSNNPYGWNLLGNPYPSAIDWDLVTIPPEMNGEVHYIQASDGADISYVSGGGGGGRYVPPMQGFFVSAISAGSLQVTNAARTHTGTGNYYKSEIEDLLVLEASGNGYVNESRIFFNQEATQEHDRLFDAYKIITTSNPSLPQIYSMTPTGVKLGINGLPETPSVPVGFICGIPGEYTITASETSEFANVVLEDLVTGIKTDLLKGTYTFNYDLDVQENRFIVHFTPLALTENLADLINIYSNQKDVYVSVPSNTDGNIVIYNVMGQEVASMKITGTSSKLSLDKSAYYFVKVMSNESIVTKKVFVK
jgi:hypothetical protein